jgi:hypothetical protein
MTLRVLWLAILAAQTVVAVADALAMALSTAVLATTLTAFSPLFKALD